MKTRLPVLFLTLFLSAVALEPGKRISIGGYALQIHCTGKGPPTAVIETGFGDLAFDWFLVQRSLETKLRVCTYDRAGYGSSDAVASPRTLDQLNLELHTLLKAAAEKGPFIFVGHSFGGTVVRNYAARYPEEVAGMVLIDSVAERQALILGGKPHLLKEFASGKPIPQPTLDAQPVRLQPAASKTEELSGELLRLPQSLQALHKRFSAMPSLEAAEASAREWSSEYYARWFEHPQKGLLGSKPLVVVTRASGGYEPSENYSADEVEGQRLRAQTALLELSSNAVQVVLPVGHNMHLEAPDRVAWAILLAAARK